MHSSYFTVLKLLLIANLTAFGNGLSTRRPHVMQIGVHFTYNHEVQKTFNETNRDPNYYFTVLLNAVETRLATISYPSIELTLVGTNAINESNAIEPPEMNKTQIYESYKKYYTQNRHKLDCPDAAFYVTRKYFMEIVHDESSTQIGGLCGNASMGVFYDDGVSFLGVHALSRELAFLIGAKRDNRKIRGCEAKDRYLTATLDDSSRFYLSQCAEDDVQEFFLNNSRHNCWSDTPIPVIKNNWALPSKYLEDSLNKGQVDLCTAHRFYFPFIVSCRNYSSRRKFRSCRVSCCEEDTNDVIDYVMEPDGTACGYFSFKKKMCIHGQCVEVS
uniref:Putative secreted metalloprotease n=1 Tax=Ixodes ricinus TaxID=34613 RepID=A0A6B0V9R7_IXORI